MCCEYGPDFGKLVCLDTGYTLPPYPNLWGQSTLGDSLGLALSSLIHKYSANV